MYSCSTALRTCSGLRRELYAATIFRRSTLSSGPSHVTIQAFIGTSPQTRSGQMINREYSAERGPQGAFRLRTHIDFAMCVPRARSRRRCRRPPRSAGWTGLSFGPLLGPRVQVEIRRAVAGGRARRRGCSPAAWAEHAHQALGRRVPVARAESRSARARTVSLVHDFGQRSRRAGKRRPGATSSSCAATSSSSWAPAEEVRSTSANVAATARSSPRRRSAVVR
jgi:hypothetical protein